MGMSEQLLDLHTQDRLEALLLLLREADPAFVWDRQEVLRHALEAGLRVMLADVLLNGQWRGYAKAPGKAHLSV